jgi:transcriptional regulator with XRE-family HTH domain
MLRIKEICKEKGLELKKLAEMYGTTYQSLFAVMTGNPTIDTLQKISDLLDVSISELFEEKKVGQILCPHCGKEIKIEVK